MYSHKLPDGYNFWLQLKNLFFRHPYMESQSSSIISPQPFTFPAKPIQFGNSSVLQRTQELSRIAIKKNAGKWRNNWEKFLLADVDYERPSADSGFSNITVHLNNKTQAGIDYIQFAVSTFEETGKLYKSEYAEVFNVAPLSSVDIPVYSSSKGKTMNVCITQVVASSFDLQFSKNAYE